MLVFASTATTLILLFAILSTSKPRGNHRWPSTFYRLRRRIAGGVVVIRIFFRPPDDWPPLQPSLPSSQLLTEYYALRSAGEW